VQGRANLLEFQEIQSAFTGFIFANKRLRASKLFGKVYLAKTSFSAYLTEQVK
jgi:hypothetical protein